MTRLRMIMLCMVLVGGMMLLASCSKSAVDLCVVVYDKNNSAVVPVAKTEKESYYFMPRHQAILERIKKEDVNIIFIGDSITHGWEAARQVWDKYYSYRGAVNMGFGGDRTQHVLWRLDNGEINGIFPKLAVIMIGTNNLGDNTAVEIADGIKAICCRLRIKLPHTKILLLGIFPRGGLELKDTQKISQVNKIIARFSDDQMIYFLDIGASFLDNNGNISKEIMPDLLHPNLKGYEIWAQAIEPTVAVLMRNN